MYGSCYPRFIIIIKHDNDEFDNKNVSIRKRCQKRIALN